MLQITDKSKCCGCNACVQRCPKQCIVMHAVSYTHLTLPTMVRV